MDSFQIIFSFWKGRKRWLLPSLLSNLELQPLFCPLCFSALFFIISFPFLFEAKCWWKSTAQRQSNFSSTVLSKYLSSLRKSQEIAFSSTVWCWCRYLLSLWPSIWTASLALCRGALFCCPPIFLWYPFLIMPSPDGQNLLMLFLGPWGVSAWRLVTEAHVPGRVTTPAIFQRGIPSWYPSVSPWSLSGEDVPGSTPGQPTTWTRLWSMEARARSV